MKPLPLTRDQEAVEVDHEAVGGDYEAVITKLPFLVEHLENDVDVVWIDQRPSWPSDWQFRLSSVAKLGYFLRLKLT